MLPSDKQQTIKSPLLDTAKQSMEASKHKNRQSAVFSSSKSIRLLSTAIKILLFCSAASTRGLLTL